jgi:hypothetical protein
MGKSKLAKHAYEEGHKVGWGEAGILDIESTASIGNTKKRPICLALSTRLANPVWTFLPSGTPLSTMSSTFHREDLFDMTDVHLFLLGFRVESRGFAPRMTQAAGTVLASSPPL